MKIAVTYDNGEIFQHFGKTKTFKVYEVELFETPYNSCIYTEE